MKIQYKDQGQLDWHLKCNANHQWTNEQVVLALLHAIRDELRKLNQNMEQLQRGLGHWGDIATELRSIKRGMRKSKKQVSKLPKFRRPRGG